MRRGKARLGILLAAPSVALMSVFFLFPLGSAIYFSLTSWNGVQQHPPFIGLANFTALLRDKEVWHALGNNAIWLIIGTVSPIVIGLALAILLWSGVRGALLYRLSFFLPYVLPPIVVAIVWSWIYDPLYGWLNRFLSDVGLGAWSRGWLGEPGTALFAVLGAAVWSIFGFVVVIFLSALQNVDTNLLDAARIDGANARKRLTAVILPQIMPVLLMVTTVTLVGGFSVFDIVFIMTGGGPGNATDVLGTYSYMNAFQLNRVGYGTAIALVITLLSLPFVFILNRLQRRHSLARLR